MERLLRLMVSLSLSGFLALSGLGLTCYSMLRIVSAFRDYKRFAETQAVLEAAIGPQGDGSSLMEVAEKTFFFIGFLPLVLIIPGLYLFGFGLRRMIRKVRQGLPEAATKPETKTMLWISTAIYAFGVLITAPTLTIWLIMAPETIPIVFQAIETPAKAIKAWPNENSGKEEPDTYFVQFEFLDNQGSTVQSVLEVLAPLGENFTRHPNATIAYVPGRTDDIYLARSIPSVAGYLWSFIWRIGILYLAVCGLLANFLTKSPNGPMPTYETSFSNSHSRTGGSGTGRRQGKRSEFGRRGLS